MIDYSKLKVATDISEEQQYGIDPDTRIYSTDRYEGPKLTLKIAEKLFGEEWVIDLVECGCSIIPDTDIECELGS